MLSKQEDTRCNDVNKIRNTSEKSLCPRVRSDDYILFPPLSQDIYDQMEAMVQVHDEFSYSGIFGGCEFRQCFFFIRDNLTGKGFVDIYIRDLSAFDDSLKRFVICDGYALVAGEEAQLLAYIRNTDVDMTADNDVMDRLYRQVTEKLPHWHYLHYPGSSLSKALEHLYFASHRSGCREILYKAGLSNIAFNIEAIPYHDPLGSNPESIIGHGIPLGLLKILDDSEDLEALQNEEKLKCALRTYREFSGFTEKCLPSRGQWEYLKCLSEERENGSFKNQKFGNVLNRGFNRRLYRNLKNDTSGFLYQIYMEYLWLWDELSLRGRKRIPRPEDLEDALEDFRAVKRYRDEHAPEDQKIKKRKENEDFEYEGREYCLLMPSSCLEICLEGLYQKNCVASYILSHTASATTILFLRRKSAPDRSFVTVEVRSSMIIQVYAKMNKLPDASVFRFLEDYCREKGIVLDPYLLAAKEIAAPEELEELEDEDVDTRDHLRKLTEEGWSLLGTGLKEYIRDYRERYEWKPFPCEDPLFSDKMIRVQLTLEDLFPEAFRQVNR